jgi:transcriptional regulator with XRE-family HTH domain
MVRASASPGHAWAPAPKVKIRRSLITAEDFAQTLKRLRGSRTKAQCAREAGINANAWTHYEKARRMPNPATSSLLAKGLGVTLAKLEEELLVSRNKRLRQEEERARTADVAPRTDDDSYSRAVREGLDIVHRELEKLLLLAGDLKRGRP